MHLHITSQEKTDLMEEVLTEVSVYLGMLYHIIEAFKDHDDFADELSTSLIQYLKYSLTCGDFSEFGSSTPGLSFYCRSWIEGEECERLSNKKG